MVGWLLTVLVTLAAPEVTVTAPDTVRTGEVFTVEVRVTGGELRSASCVPESTGGLDYLGASTMSSFTSVSTPSGTRMVSEMVMTMSFSAQGPGTYVVGPFTFTATGTGRMQLQELTVVVSGAAVPSGPSRRTRTVPRQLPPIPVGADTGSPAWVEVVVDTSGTLYPGCSFQADYLLCTRRQDIWNVTYGVDGSSYARSRTLEAPAELSWRRGDDGIKQALLARIEITPAFPCSLWLPVVSGQVTISSGFMETEYDLPGDSTWVPVMPFPEEGMPTNFSGVADSISIRVSQLTGGYSLAGERGLEITAGGPGASMLSGLPDIAVAGPALLRTGSRSTDERRREVSWLLLVEPSDSGTVIVGPDSVAWFDRGAGVYRQSMIEPCTLSVRAPANRVELPELDPRGDRGAGITTWVAAVLVLSLVVLVLVIRRTVRRGTLVSVTEAIDAEELLTAMESEASRMLTGSRRSMGAEELCEALDDAGVDNILSRRFQRHWKDLELSLSGRTLSQEQLANLKGTSTELLEELAADLDRSSG